MSAQTKISSIKGWCPGAHRPMMSGDGLVVRIRPICARLTADQVLGLCDAAQHYASGLIELTNRANLQLRGVTEETHSALLAELAKLELLDADEAIESRRNILVSPFWKSGGLSENIASDLQNRLSELPDLPAKFGFAVDCESLRQLSDAPADIRIESGRSGAVIIRADGMKTGRPVEPDQAVDHAIALAQWFAETRANTTRRIAPHLVSTILPSQWTGEEPVDIAPQTQSGQTIFGAIYGLPFGRAEAPVLARLINDTDTPAIRITPWRSILFEDSNLIDASEFITTPNDPLSRVDACPGAPACSSASVETRQLARDLAGRWPGRLHVSGCEKGCARTKSADITLVGRNGAFDLVRNGRPWDGPSRCGLSVAELMTEMELPDAL